MQPETQQVPAIQHTPNIDSALAADPPDVGGSAPPALTGPAVLDAEPSEDKAAGRARADAALLTAPAKPAGTQLSVRQVFGDHSRTHCQSGRVKVRLFEGWNKGNPQWSFAKFSCHEKLAPLFTAFFEEITESPWGHLLRSVDGFEYQIVRPGAQRFSPNPNENHRISLRSYGIAVQVNRLWNEPGLSYRPFPEGDPVEFTSAGHPGYRIYVGHPFVRIAKDYGLTWAGGLHWDGRDGMTGHQQQVLVPESGLFQYCEMW